MHEEMYFKELAHKNVSTGKSEVSRANCSQLISDNAVLNLEAEDLSNLETELLPLLETLDFDFNKLMRFAYIMEGNLLYLKQFIANVNHIKNILT
jgi:hypothetical protein